MQNSQLLFPLNDVLTVKSAARMQCVCKTFKLYIKVKNYSFYRIFKQLEINKETIVKMIFETDQEFIEQDDIEDFYYHIGNHKYGYFIREYVVNNYLNYILEAVDSIHDQGLHNFDNGELMQYTCDYIVLLFKYKPLQGVLIELCIDEINKL
jgi:hypothetical protein